MFTLWRISTSCHKVPFFSAATILDNILLTSVLTSNQKLDQITTNYLIIKYSCIITNYLDVITILLIQHLADFVKITNVLRLLDELISALYFISFGAILAMFMLIKRSLDERLIGVISTLERCLSDLQSINIS